MNKRSPARFILLCLFIALYAAVGAYSVMAQESQFPAKILDEVPSEDYSDKLIILHSNDVHGAIGGYAKMTGLRSAYEKMGAEVLMADAGDFSQGDPYINTTEGLDAVAMMNAAGYDLAIPGNHDFDYGAEQFLKNVEKADFPIICANIPNISESVLKPRIIFNSQLGINVGFFGIDTPETMAKTDPRLIAGYTFLSGSELYGCAQEQIDLLKDEGADIVIALTHLGVDQETVLSGNSSLNLYEETTGIDLILDGHSHTVMTGGQNGEPIQSTGTKFAYIGVVVVDKSGKIEDHYLLSADNIPGDPSVESAAGEIEARVDAEYQQVIAESEVTFEGTKENNRSRETNSGDLITDALLWYIGNNTELLSVPMDHVIALVNGGSIRDSIPEGDITKKNINTVFPFGNTVSIVSVTGNELLEVLEASTFCTPDTVGGYPQTAGIKFRVDTTKEYDEGELYPNSTYHSCLLYTSPSVESIGGRPFDASETYTVVTNNFVTDGGDTMYLFGTKEAIETGEPIDELLTAYISDGLGGVLTEERYGKVRGDQTIILASDQPSASDDSITGGEAADAGENDAVDRNSNADEEIYIVKKNDNLWKIARLYYGSGIRWPLIYERNRDVISDPSRIYIGQELVIPDAA